MENTKKRFRLPLLARIVMAIALGIVCGQFFNETAVRVFITLNTIFSQFLSFMVPLIIIGLVAHAIADLGRGAGKLLAGTIGIAYIDTMIAGMLAYFAGSWLFPDMVAGASHTDIGKTSELSPFFDLKIPAVIDVMSALVLSFIMGVGMSRTSKTTSVLYRGASEFLDIITRVINDVIIPLLPIYIFGIFLNMTYTGEAYSIMTVFAQIIIVLIALHLVILIYEFTFAGLLTKRNPLKMLLNMLPAYFTALGTSSSAATIPVTLRQTRKIGVSDEFSGFTIPLFATIHIPGSMMKITACSLAICMINGLPHSFPLFLNFMLVLAICMVAAPSIPGGAAMAALAPMASVLGFSGSDQALIIALYIALDSMGTACNVTSDGALSMIVQKVFKKEA